MVFELFWTFFNIALYILLAIFTAFAAINVLTAVFSLRPEPSYQGNTPHVSVIVRTWNDGAVVERCINSHINQAYPKGQLEVIIVDDGSTDDTQMLCGYYAKKGLIKYVRLPEHHELKAEVIDHAIQNFATGEIILETDVDAVLPQDWVKQMVKQFSDPAVAAVTGVVMAGNWFQGSISRVRAMEDFWHFCTAMYGRYRATGQGLLYGGNKGYRRSAWLSVGGHPRQTMVEDAEFAMKLLDAGYKIAIVKSAPVIQEEVTTFSQYMSEQKRWTKGNLDVARKYSASLQSNLLAYLFTLANFSWDAVLFWSFVLTPYQLLFIAPILINLLALYVGLFSFRARTVFWLFAPIYLWVGPFLRAIVILSLLKSWILKQPVTWTKVHHYPTPLKWPTH
jgi:cellulose synthase/poly-beta-1,6-N-acetylglucosamine synthase-like glycosyltransferase